MAKRRAPPDPHEHVFTVRWIRSRKCLAADPITRWRWSEPSQAERMTLAEAEAAAARMGGVVCVDGVPVDRLGADVPKKPRPVRGPEGRPDPIAVIARHMAEDRWTDAMRVAVKLRRLSSEDRAAIERALTAIERPDFCRQIRRDPNALVQDGIARIRRLFGGSP